MKNMRIPSCHCEVARRLATEAIYHYGRRLTDCRGRQTFGDLAMTASLLFFIAFLLISGSNVRAEEAPAKPTQITSDNLQLEKGGLLTLFRGNVLLKQLEQWIKADVMTRSRLTGVANAKGNVVGTWFSPKGEKIIGVGDFARYIPLAQTTELWGDGRIATLTRWETVGDTMPVVMNAIHFTAKQKENVMLAHDQVVITQAPRFVGHSEEALYDRNAGTLEMWGLKQVAIHLNDGKGSGDFLSDRAWMNLEPRRARLTGHVTGHVIPSPT
jgi:lipopolysaccharide export system protein LptA